MVADCENPPQPDHPENILTQITSQPKRQFSKQEINKARGNLTLMNDRVFLVTFDENKNNDIITDIVNALRKIHNLPPIPEIQKTTVQKVSYLDVLGRGMVGDLLGEAESLNITVEVQKTKQDDYAVRGTLTSSNAMRNQFIPGDDFTDAPDTIGISILGFNLPQLDHRKEFCSRIIRAEYESKEPFLADKYSDYYIELPKMDEWTKEVLPNQYHGLWELCHIFKAKIKDHEEVIRMQAIQSQAAISLSKAVKRAVAPDEFVNEALNQQDELEQLRSYFAKREEKRKTEGKEEMIIMAIQSNFAHDVIETMRKGAGISEARLIELKEQAQSLSTT